MREIVGVGVDMVEVARVARANERFGDRLWARLFSPEEQRECSGRLDLIRAFAARFAAKEAVIKALAPGSGVPLSFREITITREGDKPRVSLSGGIAIWARRQNISEVLVSLSHERGYAVACAIAVRDVSEE